MRKRKIAAFDIDGTVFRSSLLLELVEALIAEGVFPAKTRKTYERERERWMDRKGDYEAYINKAVRAFAKHVKGMPLSVGQKIARRIIAEKKDRTYRYTRDLVKKLKRQGYFLVAISHSPKFIVGPYAAKLGFGKVYGSIYAADAKGKFTGTVEYEDMIRDKAAIFRHVLEKFNGDVHTSIAVGDTESDIPMLKRAGEPIAFNPNKKLYAYAKRQKWKIVVERKDVIYEL